VTDKTEKKIFDDFQEVSCNDCEHYWDTSCDGVPEGSKRLCNGFKATRSVILPAKIERLEKGLQRLTGACAVMAIGLVILALVVTL
jgi:hypothetical protein